MRVKIYILCDMEGISGIRYPDQVESPTSAYEEGRQLMMADVNAAVEGCFRGGAKEVLVCDTHGGGGQLRLEQMDPRATYERPAQAKMMPSLDSSFAGVMLLGHHAMAGTANAFLDHTMDSGSWFEYRLNGRPLGEIGIEAAFAGHFDVPVVLVSGDEACCQEARATLGEVETAVVKWALWRNRARCLPPSVARARITEAAAKATAGAAAKAYKPFKPALPATIELTLYRTDYAENYLNRSTVERVGPRTIRVKIDSLLNLSRW
jgi:D-amino peptidase